MLTYLVLLVILFIVVSAVVMQLFGAYLLDTTQNEQLMLTDQLATEVAPYLKASDAQQLYDICVRSAAADGGHVLVLSKNGTVLIDSFSELNGYPLYNSEIDEILNKGQGRSFGYHPLQKEGETEWTGYFVSSIIYDGKLQGMVFRSISMMELNRRLDSLWMSILLYFFVVLIGIVLLGFFMSDLISRPINRLNGALQRATRGDFSVRAAVTGNDEISELSRTFNIMSEKIENLDHTRNRFISNASHELKTPLSAIKVLVETILLQEDTEMDPAMVKDFLGDVNLEVDRLSSIVGDLLTLVQIDSGATRLNLTMESMEQVVDETVHRLEPVAKSKGIELALAIQEDARVMIDRTRFAQAAYNLIDNAIKYSKPEGHVSVEVDHDGADAILTIRDDGIGIPKEDIPNLFDRFYRVDKARSRGTGGTGLGLSIVRETINLHGGTVEVTSVENEGTTFVVRIPLPEEEL